MNLGIIEALMEHGFNPNTKKYPRFIMKCVTQNVDAMKLVCNEEGKYQHTFDLVSLVVFFVFCFLFLLLFFVCCFFWCKDNDTVIFGFGFCVWCCFFFSVWGENKHSHNKQKKKENTHIIFNTPYKCRQSM